MYNVGIIGAGMIGSNYDAPNSGIVLSHAHAIVNSENFYLKGFYDTNINASKDAARKWNTSVFDSFEEVKKSCDVICCAVSDSMHYVVLKEFYESENIKAIICEKPLASKVKDAVLLVEGFEHSNIPIVVNYSRRYMNSFNMLKYRINELGGFILGNCCYGKGLIHNGSHLVNILDYLIGLNNYSLKAITQIVYDYDNKDPSIGFVITNGDNLITFNVIPCDVTTVFQFELFFEKGKIVYDGMTNEIRLYNIRASQMFKGYTNYLENGYLKVDRGNALINLYKNLYNIIQGNEDPYSDGTSALNTLKFCEFIQEGVNK